MIYCTMHHLNDQHHSLLLPLLCSEVPPSLSVLLCMLLLPFMSILPCRPLSLTYHCDECFLMFPHRQDWPKWCATLATIQGSWLVYSQNLQCITYVVWAIMLNSKIFIGIVVSIFVTFSNVT